MKHSKGKWKVGKPYSDKPFMVFTANPRTAKTDEVICWADREANAHLIAQSPRMAEWLERLVKQNGWVYQKDLDEANEILAQAR